MAKKGGYQIIDLQGRNFATSGTMSTYKGIYDLVENTLKPIVVSGLVINGVEVQDFYVTVTRTNNITLNSGTYSATSSFSNITITINSDDLVTVTWA